MNLNYVRTLRAEAQQRVNRLEAELLAAKSQLEALDKALGFTPPEHEVLGAAPAGFPA